MEIRVAVTAYVADRIAALRQSQAHLPAGSPDKVKGGYENVSVIRANSMKHMPNFFSRGQVRQIHSERSKTDIRIVDSVDEIILLVSGPALQAAEAEGENHHVGRAPGRLWQSPADERLTQKHPAGGVRVRFEARRYTVYSHRC